MYHRSVFLLASIYSIRSVQMFSIILEKQVFLCHIFSPSCPFLFLLIFPCLRGDPSRASRVFPTLFRFIFLLNRAVLCCALPHDPCIQAEREAAKAAAKDAEVEEDEDEKVTIEPASSAETTAEDDEEHDEL